MADRDKDGIERYGETGKPSYYDFVDNSCDRKDQAGHQGGRPGDAQGTNLPKGGTGTEKGGNKGSSK
jgi:hypothetical protein